MTMEKGKNIYGMLSTINVEVPFETEEQRAEAEKLSAQIKAYGARLIRAATEWGYMPYEKTAANVVKANPLQKYIPPAEPVRFKSGDLVKIFRTVTDGDVLWQGKVEFDFKAYHHGLQKGVSGTEWMSMFVDQLPARLERDGETIFGALEPFCETGTEGIVWSVSEYGKTGYDGLHTLKDGDSLTVYGAVRDGEVEWEGTLDFTPEKLEKVGWTEILRQANHMPTQKWLEMSWQKRPAVIVPKPV